MSIYDGLHNADYLAKTRICARLMNKDIKAANFIHNQYEEITQLRATIASQQETIDILQDIVDTEKL